MRRILFSAFLACSALAASAQIDTTAPATKIFRPMETRSKDHLLIQFGGALWNDRPDSIKTKGFSRSFNIFLMWDFPFKSSPKMSIALGPGLATDHVFLDKMTAGIKDNTPSVIFDDRSDTIHFKKYKVSTAFLELPIELRFSSNPEADGKSIKAALGVKVGTMISAWVKGKDLENASGGTVNEYIMKEKSKRFFNTARISATARLGYGHFSLFGTYSFTKLFKEGVGPKMNAMSIGLTLSGL
jgi:hypothetical protein